MLSIKEQLAAHGVYARKDLGQHYLIEADAVRAMVEAADLQPDDTVLEVGPGPGVLTPRLCGVAGAVVAVELDERIIKVLKANTATLPNLEIIHGDVLKFDASGLPSTYKVVGNLPYYITSAIIKRFLTEEFPPVSLTVTIQAEVAERIVAVPPKMSVLALSVQLYGVPRLVRRVPKESFWPVPQVDSAILVIDDIGQDVQGKLNGLSEAEFFKVVRAGFAEKRKQLHNSLTRNMGHSGDKTNRALEKAGIMPSRRAETLTIEEWVRVGRAYAGR